MKHFNKKIAIAMLCTTVMSSFPVPSFAASDIKGHWAEANIAQMQSQGYIGGYSDGSFHPDKEITRAEFVAALNKILGLTGDGKLSEGFDTLESLEKISPKYGGYVWTNRMDHKRACHHSELFIPLLLKFLLLI